MTAPALSRHACVLTGYSGSRTATVTVASYDWPARLWRALKILGQFWGLALASVFIPVAHFLLVPSFLLCGIFGFWQRLGAAEVVTEARGTCPDCGAEQKLDMTGRWSLPREIACSHCRRGLRLTAG